jgi:hypothetical protein
MPARQPNADTTNRTSRHYAVALGLTRTIHSIGANLTFAAPRCQMAQIRMRSFAGSYIGRSEATAGWTSAPICTVHSPASR